MASGVAHRSPLSGLLGLLAIALVAVAVAALALGLHGLVAWPSWVVAEARARGTGVEVSLNADPDDPERPAVLPADAEVRLAAVPEVVNVVTVRRDGQARLGCGGESVLVTVGDLPPNLPPVGLPLLVAGSYPAAVDEVLVGHRRAHRCGLAVGADISLRPAPAGGEGAAAWPARVAGLVGSDAWGVLVPRASYDQFAAEPADRAVLLRVTEGTSRAKVRDGVREALPEIPARALATRDQRTQVEQRAGSWRLRAAALAAGGLLAAGIGAAAAYAVGGVAGGAVLLGLGLLLGLALTLQLPAAPVAFQVPYLPSTERLGPLLGTTSALVVVYALALVPPLRRRTRLGLLLRWGARHRDTLAAIGLALLGGAVWLYAYNFVDPVLSGRERELLVAAWAAGLLTLAALLLGLATPSGQRLARQAWQRLSTAPPGEPRVGRFATRLAGFGAAAWLLTAVGLLAASLASTGDDPEGYIFLAEVAAALALLHGYAAFGLGPAAAGGYRAMVLLAVSYTLAGATAPLALPIAVLLLRPPARAYYRGGGPAPPAAAPEPAAAEPIASAAPDGPTVPLSAESMIVADPLFAALPLGERQRLAALAGSVEYAPGAVVLNEGDRGQDLYGLAAGRLVVEGVGLGGEVLPLAELEPGAWFGEMALLTGAPRSATIRALTSAVVVWLPSGPLRDALATTPAFAAALRQRVDYLDLVGFLQRFSPFATLPRTTVLAVAERVQPLSYPAGTPLAQAGEPGTAWYLVRRGRATATWPDGTTMTFLPGDSFGEEALLRDAPSTHTVAADTDLDVLALGRDDFRAAVAAHGPLRRFFAELLRARYAGAPDQALGLPDPVATLMPGLSPRGRGRTWLVLACGLVLLAALSLASAATEHGAIIALTILVGAFLAPAVYLGYLRERDLLGTFTWRRLLVIGAFTALVAIPVAVFAEHLVQAGAMDFGPALLTALIEEAAKLLGVVWLLWRRHYRFELDGIVFGVAAGLWFAGLENVVYAFGALATADSPEAAVGAMLGVVWLRLVTSFFGHGVWTGLICAAIWRGKGGGAPRWDWEVVRAFALAVLLHTLWDWSPAVFILPVALFGTLLLRERIQRASEAEQQALLAFAMPSPGRRLPADGVPDETVWPCPRCGAADALGTLYCIRCGAALVEPRSRLSTQAQP